MITSEIDFAEIHYKGYKFILKKDLTIDDSQTSLSNEKTYTITYDANGGTGAPATQKKIEGHSLTLSTTVPTKSGYVFLGWSKNKTATEAEYEKGASYTNNEDVTLWAVWKVANASEIITIENYGESVNYTANGIDDWKVFLNDGKSIYIIASDYVPRSGMTLGTGISAGDGDYCVKGDSQSNFVSWLQNASNWSKYSEGFSGATTTGGATLEQFWSSYNKKYDTNYSGIQDLSSNIGYSNTLYFPHELSWNSCYGYWLASAESSNTVGVQRVHARGDVDIASSSVIYYRYSSISMFTIQCQGNKRK